jgi:hypothetical protein
MCKLAWATYKYSYPFQKNLAKHHSAEQLRISKKSALNPSFSLMQLQLYFIKNKTDPFTPTHGSPILSANHKYSRSY